MFNSTLDRLQEDHRRYDGLLCILDRQLFGARRGDQPDIVLLHDILGYMTRHAERTHHAFEDRLYERLAARYPALLPTLDVLNEEHRRIAVYGEELYVKLAGMVGMADGAELEPAMMDVLQAYIELYRAHMRCEERQVLGSATADLPGSDWVELVTHCDWRCDPLFRAEADRAYRELKTRIATQGAGYWMGRDERADFCPLCS
ncbi:MAG: hemerythrin domain-containing protein [Halomonas sp.]|nr:hemerythrin domain-containing protein [Halomonas sp.]